MGSVARPLRGPLGCRTVGACNCKRRCCPRACSGKRYLNVTKVTDEVWGAMVGNGETGVS